MEISRAQQQIGLILLTLGLLLPFVGKAVHLDDPIFLWTAEQIREAPADFLGFDVNWYGSVESMSRVNKNPPLVSYYLALVLAVIGRSEVALHLGMLLPSLAFVVGLFRLAWSFCRNAWLAVAVSVATPVFLVSATSLMADVPMLAFFVGSLGFFVHGLDEGRNRDYWIAGLLLGLGILTKYSCLALLPLMLAYGLARKRRIGPWLSAPLIGFAIALTYDVFVAVQYGFHPLLDVARFSVEYEVQSEGSIWQGLATGFFFLGGCTLGSLLWLPAAWKPLEIAVGLALSAIVSALFLIPFAPKNADLGITVQQFGFALAGLHVIALVGYEWSARRDADSLLLGLWVLGFFAFAAFANWTTNARSILPCVPAIAILLVRRLESRGKIQAGVCGVALVGSLALAISVGVADWQWADSARRAARELAESGRESGGRVYFQGSWGFQRYMEEAGSERIAFGRTRLAVGDRVVIPMNTANAKPLPRRRSRLIRTESFAHSPWIAIMSAQRGAGFYASGWGALPYSFGPTHPERYGIFEMVREWEPKSVVRNRLGSEVEAP